MKILLCHNHYRLRSGEDVAFDFAKHLLEESGHELVPYEKHSAATASSSLVERIKLGPQVVYSPGCRREVRDIARRERPGVALIQNVFPLMSPSIYYGLGDAGVPVVQMVFNYRMLCVNGQFFTGGQICERCAGGNYIHGVLRRCLNRSYSKSAVYASSLAWHRLRGTWKEYIKFFVVPDAFLKNKLQQAGLPAERIRVVCNPFDVDRHESRSGGNYALFVGRFIRPKGILTLLDATLNASSVPVVIAGDGEDAADVRHHPAVLNGRVTLLPATYGKEFEDLLARSAMVIVPSEWYDNLPMIVCQAFAAGKPVIASRINGIPEYVKDGENGLLFSPGDSGELASCMQRLFGDKVLQQKLSREARRTAETVLSAQSWCARMDSILEEATAGQSTSVRRMTA